MSHKQTILCLACIAVAVFFLPAIFLVATMVRSDDALRLPPASPDVMSVRESRGRFPVPPKVTQEEEAARERGRERAWEAIGTRKTEDLDYMESLARKYTRYGENFEVVELKLQAMLRMSPDEQVREIRADRGFPKSLSDMVRRNCADVEKDYRSPRLKAVMPLMESKYRAFLDNCATMLPALDVLDTFR